MTDTTTVSKVVHDSTSVLSGSGTLVLWILLAAVVVGALAFWLIFGRRRTTVVTTDTTGEARKTTDIRE